MSLAMAFTMVVAIAFGHSVGDYAVSRTCFQCAFRGEQILCETSDTNFELQAFILDTVRTVRLQGSDMPLPAFLAMRPTLSMHNYGS